MRALAAKRVNGSSVRVFHRPSREGVLCQYSGAFREVDTDDWPDHAWRWCKTCKRLYECQERVV